MLPDEALSPGGCEHSIFTAKVATALERIPDAVQAKVSDPCSRLGGRLQSMRPFRAVPYPHSKFLTDRMNSSRMDGGRANGKRTNLVGTRGFRPACGRNHPDVHCPLERHGRENLRGSNGNSTRH